MDPDVSVRARRGGERALDRAGIGWADVVVVELNEAFASSRWCASKAGRSSTPSLNIHGGAIALGHPLGATGGRVLGTLAAALRAAASGWGVASICIGVGQGLAIVLEDEQA